MRKRGWLGLLALVLCAGCNGNPTDPQTPTPTPTPGESAVLVLTAANFDAQVLASAGAVMVDFYLPQCSHCQAMAPIVEQLAKDFAGRAVVGKVDVSVERGLLGRYAIEAVPTFVFFKGGKELQRYVGEAPRSQLADRLEAAIGGS